MGLNQHGGSSMENQCQLWKINFYSTWNFHLNFNHESINSNNKKKKAFHSLDYLHFIKSNY